MDGGPHSIDLPMWLTDNYEVASVRGVTFDKMKNFPEGNQLGPWDPNNFDVEDTAMAMITMKNWRECFMLKLHGEQICSRKHPELSAP